MIAPADGGLYVPVSDPVTNYGGAADPYCDYHSFYIWHGNGRVTWYLHTSAIYDATFTASLHYKQCSNITTAPKNLVVAGTYGTSDTFVKQVKKGDPIATVGNWASGYSGGVGYHLHFEVRHCADFSTDSNGHITALRNCLVYDPYGWEWDDDDTIELTHCGPRSGQTSLGPICASKQTAPLWEGVQQPLVTKPIALTGSPEVIQSRLQVRISAAPLR